MTGRNGEKGHGRGAGGEGRSPEERDARGKVVVVTPMDRGTRPTSRFRSRRKGRDEGETNPDMAETTADDETRNVAQTDEPRECESRLSSRKKRRLALGEIGRPVIHHHAPTLKEVRTGVGGLDLVGNGVGKARLGNLTRDAGLAAPVTE